MAGRRRTLWRGTLLLGDDEELSIAVTSREPSNAGEETFDWAARRVEATLTRAPRSCLRTPHNLWPLLHGGQLVQLIEYSGRLKRLLEGEFMAVLYNEDSKVAPVVLLLDKEEDSVLGFCLNSLDEDKRMLVGRFTQLLEDNLASLPPGATIIPQPRDIPDSKEVAEVKRRIVEEHLDNIEYEEPVLRFGENKFQYTHHAEWRMDFHEEPVTYIAVFLQSDSRELIVFCPPTAAPALADLPDPAVTVTCLSPGEGTLSHPRLPGAGRLTVLEDLSTFEEHFLGLGWSNGTNTMLVEAQRLQTLFSSFERKHNSRVMVIPKLEAEPAYITCVVTSEETRGRLEVLARQGREHPEGASEVVEEQPCNPDEIIDGRPKWSKLRQVRKRRHKTDTEEEEVEEVLNFDRLNPHRSHIPEMDDNFENGRGEYQRVALKMMADLQVKTCVPLGDIRLGPEVEARARREMEEWQDFKTRYSCVVEEAPVEQPALQRKKTGGKVKSNKRAILAKTMRKIAI
jgi:hypothetical protein